MKHILKSLVLGVSFVGSLAASAAGSPAPRSVESFNQDWSFAQFGPMPDGSKLQEPGAAGWTIQLSASVEDAGKEAELAMDGDAKTRWGVVDSSPNQWLKLDLRRAQPVSRAEVDWEVPGANYEFVVEGSTDGTAWKPLPATVRFVRVRTTKLPKDRWASIREVRLFDDADKRIENKPVAASGASPEQPEFKDSAWRKQIGRAHV